MYNALSLRPCLFNYPQNSEKYLHCQTVCHSKNPKFQYMKSVKDICYTNNVACVDNLMRFK